MAQQVKGKRSFLQAKRVLRELRTIGDGGLRIVGWCERADEIGAGELASQRQGVSGAGGRMLILAADIKREAAHLIHRRKARDVVEAGFVGTAIVVHNGLAEVVAVTQTLPANAHQARVDSFEPVNAAAVEAFGGSFVGKIVIEPGENVHGLLVAVGDDLVRRLLKYVQEAEPCIRAHTNESCVEIAKRVETKDRRIDGAVYWDVGGT